MILLQKLFFEPRINARLRAWVRCHSEEGLALLHDSERIARTIFCVLPELLLVAIPLGAQTSVVLDVYTGRIVLSQQLDRAARTPARPGSTVKPLVLETLREHGVADRKIACPARLRIGGRRLDCTHIPLNEAVDATVLWMRLLRFGLGTATGLVPVKPRVQIGRRTSPLGASIAAKTGTTADGSWLAGWISVKEGSVDRPRYVVEFRSVPTTLAAPTRPSGIVAGVTLLRRFPDPRHLRPCGPDAYNHPSSW